MRITQHFEVVVDGVADHHLSHEEFQDLSVRRKTQLPQYSDKHLKTKTTVLLYLFPGRGVGRGVGQVSGPYAAPPGAEVGHRHRGLDEFVIDHVSFVGHHAAASQLADAPLRPRPHHLTVDSQVF